MSWPFKVLPYISAPQGAVVPPATSPPTSPPSCLSSVGQFFGINQPRPYATAQPGPGPAPASMPTRVLVDVASPAIPVGTPGAGGGSLVADGATVIVAIPAGATSYRLSFTPAFPAVPGGNLIAVPFGVDGPAAGAIPAGASQLAITPTWARLDDVDVQVNSIKATLIVDLA
jgi:hypothetical protein